MRKGKPWQGGSVRAETFYVVKSGRAPDHQALDRRWRRLRAARVVQGSGPSWRVLCWHTVVWYRAGIPLETVRRALLFGCVRKSFPLIDRPEAQPISSLRYFEGPVEDVRGGSFPAAYRALRTILAQAGSLPHCPEATSQPPRQNPEETR